MGITFLVFFHRSLLILKIPKKSLARTRLFQKMLSVPAHIQKNIENVCFCSWSLSKTSIAKAVVQNTSLLNRQSV